MEIEVSSQAPSLSRAFSPQALEDWFIAKLAAELKINPDDIEPNQPFAYYGLDSVAAISLTVEVEDLLERDLAPTLFWDYPSIAELAEYLAELSQVPAPPRAPGRGK